MLRKFIIVGDFNLNGIDLGSGYTRSSIEREFLNGFADLGLIQNINVATHKKTFLTYYLHKKTFLTYYLPHLLAI